MAMKFVCELRKDVMTGKPAIVEITNPRAVTRGRVYADMYELVEEVDPEIGKTIITKQPVLRGMNFPIQRDFSREGEPLKTTVHIGPGSSETYNGQKYTGFIADGSLAKTILQAWYGREKAALKGVENITNKGDEGTDITTELNGVLDGVTA